MSAVENNRYLERAMRLIDRQHRVEEQYWRSYAQYLRRKRYEVSQPEADSKLAAIRKQLESAMDRHGNTHPDPLFKVVEFTKQIPWNEGRTWLVSAWSVVTPGLPRVTELHLATIGQRVRFSPDGNYLHFLYIKGASRKLHIDDVKPSEAIVGRITAFLDAKIVAK